MSKELVKESMRQKMYSYNSPYEIDSFKGSQLEQSISLSSKKLKYCNRIKCVYEVCWSKNHNSLVVAAYPILPKYKIEWEESPSGMRVIEWS